MNNVLGIVLAGGVGSRLDPLTRDRAKPAVPFGGKYRIIDFVLSNCLYSGIRRILVFHQYKSHSLQKHLRDAWSVFQPSIGEYITPVAPQMRTGESWYEGTADAVYQNLYLLKRSGVQHVVILSGDHIYRMDYVPLLEHHVQCGASATVATMQLPREEASQFGVMEVDTHGWVLNFEEKPTSPATVPGEPGQSLVSMGIYVFSLDVLCKALEHDRTVVGSSRDFGKDVLPHLAQDGTVVTYRFGQAQGRVSADGYWMDVGTISAYFKAHMDLLHPTPPLDLYQADWRIRGYEASAPPAKTIPGPDGTPSHIVNSMLSSGVVVRGGTVQQSILSPNVRVENGAIVERSIILDDVVIGEKAHIRNCIIDKQVTVPPQATVGVDPQLDRQRFGTAKAAAPTTAAQDKPEEPIFVVPRGYEFNVRLANLGPANLVPGEV